MRVASKVDAGLVTLSCVAGWRSNCSGIRRRPRPGDGVGGRMPGILGAATVATHGVLDVRFERAVARLRHHARLVPATIDSPDRRATLGAVDLRIVEGSGVPVAAADGSLAVVHGEIGSLPRGENVA